MAKNSSQLNTMHTRRYLTPITNGSANTLVCFGIRKTTTKQTEETIVDIEKELNALITDCHRKGGDVWIVDKYHNNFAIRLTEEVKIKAFVPKKEEDV